MTVLWKVLRDSATQIASFVLCRDFVPDVKKFERIEVELTTACIAKCFICPRNDVWNFQYDWDVGALDREMLLRFLATCKVSFEITFCGAYGDPIYHPHYIEIVSRLAQMFPDIRIFTETNGSHRKKDWWEALGKATKANHVFSFSLDGLADTNGIYRENTKWNQIVEGVKTLRALHSGPMIWKWILFRHNQHQVLEGFRYSRELGFNTFKLVNSVKHNDKTTPTVDYDTIYNSLIQDQGDTQML